MRAKLGLRPDVDDEVFTSLNGELLDLLAANPVDYTTFFRSLSAAVRGDAEPVRGLFMDLASFDRWLARWAPLATDADAMDRVNPLYIPRNHRVEEALTAATAGDLQPLQRLLEAVSAPYDERRGLEHFAEAAPPTFGDYQTFCGT
jgi:serine/tyrosine/threonine adenylyltransferase